MSDVNEHEKETVYTTWGNNTGDTERYVVHGNDHRIVVPKESDVNECKREIIEHDIEGDGDKFVTYDIRLVVDVIDTLRFESEILKDTSTAKILKSCMLALVRGGV